MNEFILSGAAGRCWDPKDIIASIFPRLEDVLYSAGFSFHGSHPKSRKDFLLDIKGMPIFSRNHFRSISLRTPFTGSYYEEEFEIEKIFPAPITFEYKSGQKSAKLELFSEYRFYLRDIPKTVITGLYRNIDTGKVHYPNWTEREEYYQERDKIVIPMTNPAKLVLVFSGGLTLCNQLRKIYLHERQKFEGNLSLVPLEESVESGTLSLSTWGSVSLG